MHHTKSSRGALCNSYIWRSLYFGDIRFMQRALKYKSANLDFQYNSKRIAYQTLEKN